MTSWSRSRGSHPSSWTRLTDVGLLRDPAEHGRSAYDADDVNVLRSFADLGKLAIPDEVLVEVARLYADGLDEIQRCLVEVFTERRPARLGPRATRAVPGHVLGAR